MSKLTAKDVRNIVREELEPLKLLLTTPEPVNHEMHAMLTAISVKLDAMDQTHINTAIEKIATKKPAKKRVSAKSKKKAKEAEAETEAEDNETSDAEDNETSDAESTVSSPPKKAVPKKRAVKAVTDEPLEDDDDEEKKPVKYKPAKKIVRQINKADYFNMMFSKNEDYFRQLTENVRAELDETNAEALSKYKGDALKKQKQKIYYNYMTKNHDKELQNAKKEYIAEEKKKNIKVLSKESVE